MKKLIYLVVVLAIAGGGYYYWDSQKAPQVPQFMKAAISQGDVVEVVSATGTLKAERTFNVGSKVSGVVEELYVDFNEIVRQGQVLAKVNTDLLETQVRIQEANIARQEVDLANQRVQLEDAERSLERTRKMFEAKLVTQQALETAELTVKSRIAQIASAEKSKVQADVNLDQARLNVTEATIISPIDGVVVNRVVDKGQTIVGSQQATKFFDIATELTTLRLEGGVDEAEIGKVRQGMRVLFTVDAYPNVNFEGTIQMVGINPTVQQNVVTYTTVATVRNNDLRLKPGMTASMKIEVARRDDVMRIPMAALRFRPTNDMWTALKQEPPTPVGRGGGPGRNGGSGSGSSAPSASSGQAPSTGSGQAAPAAAPQQANPFQAAGRRGGNQGTREGGGRQGGGMGMNLTPEQQKQLEAIRNLPADQRAAAMARAGINFGNGGGRGGGRGGRGGNAGQAAPAVPMAQRGATSIDQLFPELVRQPSRGQVYVLRPATATTPHGTLERLDIMQGISDGTFTELVSGPAELTVGAELVTNILMPWLTPTTTGANTQGNPFSGQQGRGGMPGGMPTGGGGGGRGGGR
ncbi:MAG: efflux RND transporter periplasmic adaptor subunit [Acidimicrobiia bacterium]|nr:efflux RND transporter periplasmic adaptor subunit [Acidimicrobiia bacterium]